MSSSGPNQQSTPSSNAGSQFQATRWTVVLAARGGDTTHARAALETLCQSYWPPIYAFVRRSGHGPHDAEDLTQEFFTRLLARNDLAAVDPTKGKFRTFLLAALKHFLANEWHKANTLKRGGGQQVISIDATSAETSCGLDIPDHISPEKVFERRWAMTLLANTLARLAAEYQTDGKAALFEHLKTTLTGERTSIPYAQIATQIGTTEGNIKVAVHRLRNRYRELLREEIAQTVTGADEVEEELRSLFTSLAG